MPPLLLVPVLASALSSVDDVVVEPVCCFPERLAGASICSGGSGGADEHAIDIADIADIATLTAAKAPLTSMKIARAPSAPTNS